MKPFDENVAREISNLEELREVNLDDNMRRFLWEKASEQVRKPMTLIKKIFLNYPDHLRNFDIDTLSADIEREALLQMSKRDPEHNYNGKFAKVGGSRFTTKGTSAEGRESDRPGGRRR